MIYLDNAATSFPKPREVTKEVLRALSEYGGNPGRGSHALSVYAAEKLYACREGVAALFDVKDPMSVIFTPGTTASLNMVIKGLLHPGDHVLCSDLEHNAVYRPLAKLKEQGVRFEIFSTVVDGRRLSDEEICKNLSGKIRGSTKLVICTHASNICPVRLPIEKIGAICKEKGVFFCVDAAQSAGHLPLSFSQANIDALCLPGHKGLMGPMGCGCLILGDACRPETLVEGGSGYRSLDPQMPNELPERYEAGTLPMPAIGGLLAGIEFVSRVGVEEIGFHEATLTERLKDRLLSIKGLHIYLPQETGAILLFSSPRMAASEIGAQLDERGFCVRTGFQCAAIAHKTLGTPRQGAVRVSPGYFNSNWEIDALADAVAEILSK